MFKELGVKILEQAKGLQAYTIARRRSLHQHPELSGEEHGTSAYIIEQLKDIGIMDIQRVKTSVIGTIHGQRAGATIALRADIDALPMTEVSESPFRSKREGVMHACGHDGHTAMLLGAAKILQARTESIAGRIKLVFQSSEEIGTGAKDLMASGCLDDVAMIFGMHLMDSLETGKVSFYPGYVAAGSMVLKLSFRGKTAHASTPEKGVDTIGPAAAFVAGLDALLAEHVRDDETMVVAVTQIQGGSKDNLIADNTALTLSIRYYDPILKDQVVACLEAHAKEVAGRAEAKVTILSELPSLHNGDACFPLVNAACTTALGPEANVPLAPIMASDDFAIYLESIPGMYGSLGYRNVDKGSIHPPHHPDYTIDEACLAYGVALHTQVALDALGEEHAEFFEA